MKISEVAERCRLSPATIRFYEKSGMLPDIARGPDGYRSFNDRDLEWLTLLYWLRESGMPLKIMKRFTQLAKAGDFTIVERREILMAHARELQHRRTILDRCEAVLAVKIQSYDALAGEEE